MRSWAEQRHPRRQACAAALLRVRFKSTADVRIGRDVASDPRRMIADYVAVCGTYHEVGRLVGLFAVALPTPTRIRQTECRSGTAWGRSQGHQADGQGGREIKGRRATPCGPGGGPSKNSGLSWRPAGHLEPARGKARRPWERRARFPGGARRFIERRFVATDRIRRGSSHGGKSPEHSFEHPGGRQ